MGWQEGRAVLHRAAKQASALEDGSVVVGLDGGYVRRRHRREKRHFEVDGAQEAAARGV